jgi:putative glutamine amidotransferase
MPVTHSRSTDAPLRIGVSACFFYPDAERELFKNKTLLYAEESMLTWIMRHGALPVIVPRVSDRFPVAELVAALDGLVLSGGSDVAPRSYGEQAERADWEGDYVRDQYEIALIEECLARDKPVLGVCRGIQVLNVALGGTLYQDIGTALPEALVHRDWEVYDQLFHDVEIAPDSTLAGLFGTTSGRINSVHHQAIKDLGRGLIVEAHSPRDGIIEAVRLDDSTYVAAIQWHPEFQEPADDELLSPSPVIEEFLRAICDRK